MRALHTIRRNSISHRYISPFSPVSGSSLILHIKPSFSGHETTAIEYYSRSDLVFVIPLPSNRRLRLYVDKLINE